MSMYRPYSNVCFNNCYDFIMKSKAEKEVWELSTSLTFDDEEEMRWELDRISDLARDIMNAEYDLCEMEMDALYNAEEYDNILNGNAFRKGRNRKAKQNGKRNADKAKRLHKSDRRHGKIVPQSDKKYMDSLSGTFYRWDEKRKTFDSHKKPVVHRNRKTKIDRLNAAMDAKEKEYARFFTGFGELLEDIKYLEDRIRIYEEDIQDLEYEDAFGYLTDEGKEFLKDYKKELEDLRKYKEYKEILLRTI